MEIEYTVGPIPQAGFEDPAYLQGKEIALRYNTSLRTEGRFYADSNAREMVERRINERPVSYPRPYNISEPVAGNYYPVNALLGLEDEAAGVGLSVAVDRSLGGASLAEGSMELMVHRRTQVRRHPPPLSRCSPCLVCFFGGLTLQTVATLAASNHLF